MLLELAVPEDPALDNLDLGPSDDGQQIAALFVSRKSATFRTDGNP